MVRRWSDDQSLKKHIIIELEEELAEEMFDSLEESLTQNLELNVVKF